MKHPQTNGFVERFNRTVLDEFFRKVFRQKLYESVEALQQDLDEWLSYYNHERPHQGHRNIGRRPIERIEITYNMYGSIRATQGGAGPLSDSP